MKIMQAEILKNIEGTNFKKGLKLELVKTINNIYGTAIYSFIKLKKSGEQTSYMNLNNHYSMNVEKFYEGVNKGFIKEV